MPPPSTEISHHAKEVLLETDGQRNNQKNDAIHLLLPAKAMRHNYSNLNCTVTDGRLGWQWYLMFGMSVSAVKCSRLNIQ